MGAWSAHAEKEDTLLREGWIYLIDKQINMRHIFQNTAVGINKHDKNQKKDQKRPKSLL